jgi:outer membrane immunogenic protein
MNRLLPTFWAFAVLASFEPAGAADMPVKARIYKAAPVPYSWAGGYVGANLGYGVARNPSSLPNNFPGANPETFNLQPHGVFGGLQAGYNWQSGGWVLGVETDVQLSAQMDAQTCLEQFCRSVPAPNGFTSNIEQKAPWFGTTRGRVGYAVGPVLSYVTGGLAYGKVQTNINVVDAGTVGALSLSSTRTGWTLGSGVEAAIDGNWSMKAEYLYVDLGGETGIVAFVPASATPIVFNTRFREHLFRGGLNYRLAGGGSTALPEPTTSWTGVYLGGNFGFGVARNPSSFFDAVFAAPAPTNETFNLAPAGALGGVQAGFNLQIARWVLGLEADLQWSGQKDNQTCVGGCDVLALQQTVSIEQKLTWLGTMRGRLGYALGPALFYVTGGFATGKVTASINETIAGFAPGAFTFSHTKTGWTVGVGIEDKTDFFGLLGPNWTERTEYLYADLGSISDPYTYGGEAHALNTSIRNHIWRSALSYKFGNNTIAARY